MKNLVLAVFCACLLWTGSLVAQPSGKLAYPAATRDSTVDVYFGTKVPAPYQWMEDLNNPTLHKWVEAENAVTDAYLAKIPARGWINHRLTQLWDYAKEGTPDQLKNGMLFFAAIQDCRTNLSYMCRLHRAPSRVC